MSHAQAYALAIRNAIRLLERVDLSQRCVNLGLDTPVDGIIHFRAFGQRMQLHCRDCSILLSDADAPARPADTILILHYLLCDLPIIQTGELISFRQLSGGQFYYEPFLSRTVIPLIKRFGDDCAALKKRLDRFDWQPLHIGECSARIHAIGAIFLTLIYRCGDDEFPPSAEIFFDSAIKRVFNAEDTAAVAARICLGLLR